MSQKLTATNQTVRIMFTLIENKLTAVKISNQVLNRGSDIRREVVFRFAVGGSTGQVKSKQKISFRNGPKSHLSALQSAADERQ